MHEFNLNSNQISLSTPKNESNFAKTFS